jgi:hypothetical protein
MVHTILYDKFAAGPGKHVAMSWLKVLDHAVGLAAAGSLMLDFNQAGSSYDGAYMGRIMGQKDQAAAKRGAGLNAAMLGHVIEVVLASPQTGTTSLLDSVYRKMYGTDVHCRNASPADVGQPGDYLLQRARPHGKLFPCSFEYGSGKFTFPDIKVALGNNEEALFDITSRAQKGHVLIKGGGSLASDGIAAGQGSWLKVAHVAFIVEIHYPEMDRRDPRMAAFLHQVDPKVNPHPSQVPSRL